MRLYYLNFKSNLIDFLTLTLFTKPNVLPANKILIFRSFLFKICIKLIIYTANLYFKLKFAFYCIIK